MGKRYIAAHVSEKDVKEAWASYSKWDYYYTNELKKAQETLKSTMSSAKARLTALGITEDNPQYQRELDRISNIARADMTNLQKGQESLKTGAIKKLLTQAPISKHSKGHYQRYAGEIITARRKLGAVSDVEGDAYTGVIPATGSTEPSWVQTEEGDYQEVVQPGADRPKRLRKMTAERYKELSTLAGTKIKPMEAYYGGIWGAYDPQFDVKKERAAESEAAARGKAGSRAYNIQTQPKGRPGGGKPGNPFMQTGREIAQEKAPMEDTEKAWWM